MNAGNDQSITLPATASLVGTASDDGNPNPPATLTTTWSKVSGPGTVTFGDVNALSTTASFSVDGTYVLQLSASDSVLSASDTIQITVAPFFAGLTPVVKWKLDDALDANLADSKGTSNLVRYTKPAVSTLDFYLGGNAGAGQALTGRISKIGKWNRKLTAGEKTALAGGEGWPFSTTTTLQDAKAYYLLDEASDSATYADATGRGNTLTKTGSGHTTSVAGPGGSDKGTKFDGSIYLYRAITSDLQAGNFSNTIAGWVYLDANSSIMDFWSQFDNNIRTGAILYYHNGANRFQVDYGNDVDLYRNAVVICQNFGDVSTGTWYFFWVEYDFPNGTLSASINNGTANTLSPIVQPYTVTGKVGNGQRFVTKTQETSTASGWDFDPSSGNSRCFASLAGNNDLKFGNNAKTVWGWMKLSDTSPNQCIAGFYDFANGHIDWLVQYSSGALYFLTGDSAGNFDYTSVTLNDTNWHLFVAWFDKNGDGKIHLNLDHGAQVSTPATPSHTPASNSLDFLLGSCHNGASYTQQFTGTLDAFGIANGVPTSGDLDLLWNSGNGTESF